MKKIPKIDFKSLKIPDLHFGDRPYYSLYFICEKVTYRVDADRAGNIAGELEKIDEGCESVSDLPDLVGLLLEQAEVKGRKIWLMYEMLPAYVLNVPSLQVEGVEPEMLGEVLKFEQEALTGMSMSEMHLAHKLLKSEDDLNFYWLAFLKRDIFDRILKILKKQHCKLAGLLHPGGLPLPLDINHPSKNWLRLESWANNVFAFHYKKGDINGFQIFYPEQQVDDWQDQLDDFLLNSGKVENSEALQYSPVNPLPEMKVNFSLSDNDLLLQQWVQEWFTVLVSKDLEIVPVITIPPHEHQEIVLTVSYAAGALLFCGLMYGWNWYWINDYNSKTERLKKIQSDIAALNAQIKVSKDKRNNLSADIESLKGDLKKIPNVLEALQKRPMMILQQLATGSPRDLVIEGIDVEPDHITISGVSLKPELPNHLANFLDKKMISLGLKVNSPTKTDMVLFERGGPWKFELIVQDLGLEGFSQTSGKS